MSRLLLCLVIVICSACSARSDSDLLSGFPPAQTDFQAYAAAMQTYLLNTQLPQRSAEDVTFNVPFEVLAHEDVAYRGKFLLIHGLNDSPSVWRDWAGVLSSRGFDVRAILLPGHGNTPQAQLQVRYQDWLGTAREQMQLWRQGDEAFHLGGFSLGAVIATLLSLEALEADAPVDGLLLFSPAYVSSRNHLLRWASLVAPFKPWVFGGMIREDNPARYNSIPINAAAQYYKTTRLLKRRWNRHVLDMPVLMAASMDDSVVDVEHLRKLFQQRFSAPEKRLILYTDEPCTAAPGEILRSGAFTEDRIVNQSHMSVLIAPENAHYGRGGRQLVCNGNEWPVFSACLYYTGNDRWFGAEGTESPDEVPMARTTYNPDFPFLVEQFDQLFTHPVDQPG